MILSPGPDARFEVKDVIIVIGSVDLASRVEAFLAQ
jgi:K+/H+ antiporter YhaU regulatory subunit KhtT